MAALMLSYALESVVFHRHGAMPHGHSERMTDAFNKVALTKVSEDDGGSSDVA